MAKDPAVLIYFDKWISSTNGMKAEFRAWYFDLLLYQYDKGYIPNDEDFIAGICRVRPSEYQMFKQMLNQVLEQKFKLIDGNWINDVMVDILQKRESFKEKREISGNIGVVIKLAKTIKGFTDVYLDKLKKDLYTKTLEEIEYCKNKQVLEQMLKLYIDVDVIVDIDISINIPFNNFWDLYDKKVGDKNKLEQKWNKLKNEDREKIMQHLPKYKIAQPDKKYRKDPQTYLNNKSWNDEIIGVNLTNLEISNEEINNANIHQSNLKGLELSRKINWQSFFKITKEQYQSLPPNSQQSFNQLEIQNRCKIA